MWIVAIGALSLILIGFLTLLLGIPLAARIRASNNIRTEFFTARAAYSCVLAGIGSGGLAIIGIVVRFVMAGISKGK